MKEDARQTALIDLEPAKRHSSLVQVGKRYISSDLRWHYDLAVTYLREHARLRMVTVGELAKLFYGANIPFNKERVRRRLPALFQRCLLSNELLVAEMDSQHGKRVEAVKLYDPRSEQDRQGIETKLQRMESRKQLTTEMFERALHLVMISNRAVQMPDAEIPPT